MYVFIYIYICEYIYIYTLGEGLERRAVYIHNWANRESRFFFSDPNRNRRLAKGCNKVGVVCNKQMIFRKIRFSLNGGIPKTPRNDHF